MRRIALAAGILAVAGFCAAFFTPAPVNPACDPSRSMTKMLNPPARISELLNRSCGDCHSNETRWPWYSRLLVVGGMVSGDVEKGRKAMNLSEWRNGPKGAGLLMASCSALENGRMPRSPYRVIHPDLVPSQEEVKAFCEWAQSAAREQLVARR